jgi:hypothetical protein
MKKIQASLIFYSPQEDMGIGAEIISQLECMGVKVISLKGAKKSWYTSLFDSVQRFFRKILFRDATYISRRTEFLLEKHISEIMNSVEKADYALIIRPDQLSHETLRLISTKTNKMYGYQWDRLSRFPRILERAQYFKILFSADEEGAKEAPNVRHIDNFYFNIKKPELRRAECDVYYIGSYDKERHSRVIEIGKRLLMRNLKLDFKILRAKGELPRWITKLTRRKEYVEVMSEVAGAKILLDITVEGVHNVLSFRVLESLGYGKKLITTNPAILGCEFYDPDNMHLITGSEEELDRFLETPMRPVDPAILYKHSFDGWIRRILEI